MENIAWTHSVPLNATTHVGEFITKSLSQEQVWEDILLFLGGGCGGGSSLNSFAHILPIYLFIFLSIHLSILYFFAELRNHYLPGLLLRINIYIYRQCLISDLLHTPYQHSYHYNYVIMTTISSQVTSLAIVYSTVYSDTDERKHQSSASLAFVRGIHRGPVNSSHKGPVTRKMFPFDDVIMWTTNTETKPIHVHGFVP